VAKNGPGPISITNFNNEQVMVDLTQEQEWSSTVSAEVVGSDYDGEGSATIDQRDGGDGGDRSRRDGSMWRKEYRNRRRGGKDNVREDDTNDTQSGLVDELRKLYESLSKEEEEEGEGEEEEQG